MTHGGEAMATSANRSRIFPARSKRSYRLEMEGRTLYLLLTLMALTGVVVFYLGLVTGKAMRDPNATLALSTESRTPGPTTLSSQGLAFNEALKAKDPLIEGLRSEEEQVAERTEQLLQRGERRLELKEVSPGSETTAASRARTPAATAPSQQGTPTPAPQSTPARASATQAPVASRPAATAPTSGDLFTVQVFTSRYE
ncbi:MAG TPA: hypothetical protein VLB09_02440, partial [Nitrospiria bacterium]|nr:hypothetical protein [Nitrospiria bacterium]